MEEWICGLSIFLRGTLDEQTRCMLMIFFDKFCVFAFLINKIVTFLFFIPYMVCSYCMF